MEYVADGIIINRDLFLMWGDLFSFVFSVVGFYLILSFIGKAFIKW